MNITSSRKQDHVDLCVNKNVQFQTKTTGFDKYTFIHNALPEINFADICIETQFLETTIQMPLMISSMTGGYKDAEKINAELAQICQKIQIPMGVGSQRQALEQDTYRSSFSIVRQYAPTIPITANIGASEIRNISSTTKIRRIIDMIEANALTIHVNPLQELMQPEGTTDFSGVLNGISFLVKNAGIPIIIKEVGAGISRDVAQRLLDCGVRIIDVAGAGGTSWSGVEILRKKHTSESAFFWDWGIPTAECLEMIYPLKQHTNFTLISSGGINSAIDIAISLAIGADICASARPMITILKQQGQYALEETLLDWQEILKKIMFLVGANNIRSLQNTTHIKKNN
ncbi:MAG TPA: type 2 isopentenyl-diphosphate Delta-isomerase [Candidatus Kapabacteria bacterium]|jgi:isopentenyl-diphosphate delta-isomerase|nr:type 2 isopentenyl-diphosphate Delta-isomerase [Candidatus Kapabacteria bacterium]HRK59702.1 type 2 isopentenyl-diphosphate Delta-isomerase [Candidatus Kapabacteria bacterium]